MYLIMMKPAIYSKIKESNPYWYDIHTDAPPVYGYTESEGLAYAFMQKRNPLYFSMVKAKGKAKDEFFHQRKIDVYSVLSEHGYIDIVMTILEYEMVTGIAMNIMKGYTELIINKRPTREMFPEIADQLLMLGYGSLYEVTRIRDTSKVKPNELNIFNDELGWTLR